MGTLQKQQKQIAIEVQKGEQKVEDIDENIINKHLCTNFYARP